MAALVTAPEGVQQQCAVAMSMCIQVAWYLTTLEDFPFVNCQMHGLSTNLNYHVEYGMLPSSSRR